MKPEWLKGIEAEKLELDRDILNNECLKEPFGPYQQDIDHLLKALNKVYTELECSKISLEAASDILYDDGYHNTFRELQAQIERIEATLAYNPTQEETNV